MKGCKDCPALLLGMVRSKGGMSVERLTYDFYLGGNHCWQVKNADNLECREVCENQGDKGCKNCPISNAFDRLADIEDILGDDYDLDRLRELIQADRDGRCFISPFIAMVEQSLTNGKMTPQRDQRFNGRYAVVYFDREKYAAPLIDICGKPYDRIEAENRVKELRQKEALSALKREEAG